MTINKELVRKNFSRHAMEYDQYAKVQKEMAMKLMQLNNNNASKSYSNILEIGCGTGNLTKLLLENYPNAKYSVIDLSESMIQQTKQKIGGMHKDINFYVMDAESITQNPFEQSFDLIISNATFQWFNEPEQTVVEYMNCLNDKGVFAFSTFGPDTFHELHTSFYEIEKKMNITHQQHGQKFMSLNSWHQLFSQHMHEVSIVEERIVEQYDSVREFMYHVKRVGAGNASVAGGSQSGMGVNRKMILNMEKYYTEHYSDVKGIQATYHLCFGIYEK
ncbi:malonyl-ACP O-methyltransferase BioC [Chengkuizengella axinellae]|uniref:Malonyl-[acyl-carrier protein] O-methyltransferase n=1 Tax=Chengkuizengella axinellae TaxID=3064388 RepID=A0ABT9J1M6_9BACL|nr:malonyl-ACP O-methyltransferase BioC [Chengkuizengella sp. 2205SS18-9]MDP5274920.1 malonyl-ACP O-methyltransferase BioC [Chengkuizengella sp. 2205SS18-9]